jgi:hypothetical protein
MPRRLTGNQALNHEIARSASTLLREAGVRGALLYLAEVALEDAEALKRSGSIGPASDLRAAAKVYADAAKKLTSRVARAKRRYELGANGEMFATYARDRSRRHRRPRA